MDIGHEGFRKRYFHERAKLEAEAGNPVHGNVTREARRRLMSEIQARAWRRSNDYPHRSRQVSFYDEIENTVVRILGPGPDLATRAPLMQVADFLSMLEIALEFLWGYCQSPTDIMELQSILADDLSLFRIRDVGPEGHPVWQLQPIDNAHLHTEIVDRTFELTRIPELASAQRDYAEAWKHFSKGDFDDALVNAHKAFESAAKAIIKHVDPTSTPDNLVTNKLVPLLAQLDILPSKLQTMTTALIQIFNGAGTLRNAAGTGHGSLDLTGPEASVALLGLRMSGTFICFMAERW